jgi:RNA polymerase sigma factor (sigma-70 family)
MAENRVSSICFDGGLFAEPEWWKRRRGKSANRPKVMFYVIDNTLFSCIRNHTNSTTDLYSERYIMQRQIHEAHIDQNAEGLILENLYRNLDQRLGHPAADREICDEMKITLDEFHQMLDRINGLNLGSFQKMASQNGDTNNEPLIKYIPDTSKADSLLILQKSEIQKMLTIAIEALPKMERLITSLYYYDELTLREIGTILGINEAGILQLHTKAMLRLRSKLME